MRINKYKKFYSQFRTYFKRHAVFRRVDGSLCTGNGTEGDGMFLMLLPSVACCLLSLLPLSRMDSCL